MVINSPTGEYVEVLSALGSIMLLASWQGTKNRKRCGTLEALAKCEFMAHDRIGPIFMYGPIESGKTSL